MKHILTALDTLDAVENDYRTMLDDDGLQALIELGNARDDIRKLITLAQQISSAWIAAGPDSTGQDMVKLRRAMALQLSELVAPGCATLTLRG